MQRKHIRMNKHTPEFDFCPELQVEAPPCSIHHPTLGQAKHMRGGGCICSNTNYLGIFPCFLLPYSSRIKQQHTPKILYFFQFYIISISSSYLCRYICIHLGNRPAPNDAVVQHLINQPKFLCNIYHLWTTIHQELRMTELESARTRSFFFF